MNKKDYVTIEIELDYDVYVVLKAIARKNHQSLDTMVNRILCKYIKQLKKGIIKE
jgi:hypothetical protein